MFEPPPQASTLATGAQPSAMAFPVASEYARCVDTLTRVGILTLLPISACLGVLGCDGQEYPLPTLEQVEGLVAHHSELVAIKVPQGFDHLELTPMAMPIPRLIDCLTAALNQHATAGQIYCTRRSPSDPLIPVRVNSEKQVWLWETLRRVVETDELVYFPQEYTGEHRGLTKAEVIHDGRICALPGWSVGLVESRPILAQAGQGEMLAGRRQLEIGSSPREYLHTLQAQAYRGETGITLEDFIMRFLDHLETAHEISNDRYDDNAVWLLGNYVTYVKQVKSDLVPTGWWHRDYGRLRLDAHRPGNKQCTRSWGAVTMVRLPRP